MTVMPCGGLVVAVIVLPLTLQAQVPAAWSDCRADSLAGWNCARYYSGTVTFRSELAVAAEGRSAVTITASIAAGRVTCRVEGTDVERFEGAGMLAVITEGPIAGGTYDIVLWCPGEAGEAMTRDAYPVVEIRKRRAASFTLLEGSDAWEHPDADPVNGVSGSETVTWSLRRT